MYSLFLLGRKRRYSTKLNITAQYTTKHDYREQYQKQKTFHPWGKKIWQFPGKEVIYIRRRVTNVAACISVDGGLQLSPKLKPHMGEKKLRPNGRKAEWVFCVLKPVVRILSRRTYTIVYVTSGFVVLWIKKGAAVRRLSFSPRFFTPAHCRENNNKIQPWHLQGIFSTPLSRDHLNSLLGYPLYSV